MSIFFFIAFYDFCFSLVSEFCMKKNKALFVYSLVVAFVGYVGLNVKKSNADDLKIAIVDIQQIQEDAVVANDLKTKMQKKEQQLKKELLDRKDKIEQNYKSLEKERAVLSRSELEKKAKQFELEVQKLQFDENKYSQIFELSKIGALQVMQTELQKVVDTFVDKYDMIVPANITLYYNKKKFTDLTSDVLAKLNKNIKTIDYEKAYKDAEKQFTKIISEQKKVSKK